MTKGKRYKDALDFCFELSKEEELDDPVVESMGASADPRPTPPLIGSPRSSSPHAQVPFVLCCLRPLPATHTVQSGVLAPSVSSQCLLVSRTQCKVSSCRNPFLTPVCCDVPPFP